MRAATWQVKLLLSLLILVNLRAAVAWAEGADPLAKPSSAAARDHLARGNRLYRIREFDKAIDEYKAGALIEDAPVFQYNLGQCYRMSGRYTEALWHYNQFVNRTHPGEPIKGAIEQFTAQMTAELERAATRQQPIEPASGMLLAHKGQGEVSVSPDSKIDGSRSRWYDDGTAWIATGVGGALVATSLYLLISANNLADDALAENRDLQRRGLQERARDRRLAAYILGGGGVTVLAIGTVKLALHSDPSTSVAVSLAGHF
jgi:tetratricopeptide (TPR) repeat protein